MHPGGKKLVSCRLEDHNTDYELSEMAAQGSGPRTDDRMRRRRNDVMLPSRLAGSPRATLPASVTSLSTGCHFDSGHEGFLKTALSLVVNMLRYVKDLAE